MNAEGFNIFHETNFKLLSLLIVEFQEEKRKNKKHRNKICGSKLTVLKFS